MDEKKVLSIVKPYIKNYSITYDEFEKLFGSLPMKEQYKVTDLLDKNGILLVDDNLVEVDKEEDENSGGYKVLYSDDAPTDADLDAAGKDSGEGDVSEEEDDTDQAKKGSSDEDTSDSDSMRAINAELCRRIQAGDDEAQEELCVRNKKLVDKYAWAYQKYYGNDLDYEDIENMGMTGLLHAAEKFDLSRGTSFSTYATFWIRQYIVRGIMESGFSVRIPVHVFSAVSKASAIDNRYASEGIEPDKRIALVAKDMKISEDKAAYYLQLRHDFFSMPSLNRPVGEEEDTELGDLVAEDNTLSVEDSVAQSELHEKLNEIVGTLSEREQLVIRKRFGLNGEDVQTLDEIGKQLGITRERVRQIEAKALRRLRAPGTIRKIQDEN